MKLKTVDLLGFQRSLVDWDLGDFARSAIFLGEISEKCAILPKNLL
jgi:hypothetical protein